MPTDRDDLGNQLFVRLGELLDQPARSTRIFLGEGIQHRADQCVLDARVIGTLNRARYQGVLRDFHEYLGLTGLLAQLGELSDGKTGVLGGDQGVSLGSHIRQFGNDDFLLLTD